MAYHSKYTGAEVDALLDKIKDDDVGSIDSSLSTTSENPVQNKVITEELNKKVNKTDIATINGQTLTEGGNIEVVADSYDDTELKEQVADLAYAVTLQGTKTSLNEAEIGQLKASKADKEGYYSSLVAGAAENLINTSGDGVVRELTYDTAGGTADIGTGTAIIKRMRGKSLVWNQKVRNALDSTGVEGWWGRGRTQLYTESGKIEMTTGSTGLTQMSQKIDFIGGHKYLITFDMNVVTDVAQINLVLIQSSDLYGNSQAKISQISTKETHFAMIYTAIAELPYISIFHQVLLTEGDKTNLENLQIIDLTQMFGAGNEPATIEEFKRLFPRDDYAYNAGEVIHFNGRRLLTTGFNQWDEQWEIGSFINGEPAANANHFRSKNFIPVLPNTEYYVKIPNNMTSNNIKVYYYDKDGTWLGNSVWMGVIYHTFVTPNNVSLIKFEVAENPPYNNDICINLSWSGYRNGEYEPYEEHILELPYGVYGDGLKSAGDVYDEVTEERYVKRIGVVDLGTLNWVGSSAEGYENAFWAKGQLADKAAGSNLTTIYRITNTNGWIAASKADKAICGSTDAGYEKDIWVRDSAYADAAAFKAAMAGVMLYYELAEPIVTEFETPLNLGYYVNDFGTEMILPENGIAPFTAPAVFDILYAMNAVDTLRNLPTNYISKESFDNFTAALSSALANAGITMSIKATFDEESGTYTYTITASKTE